MKLTAQYFKNYLLSIYNPSQDFDLVITSKTPKTRAGYYRIDKRLIVIHYIGTSNLNELHNTAIHELAHYIHSTELDRLENVERVHGKEFYVILNAISTIAAQKGMYEDSKIEYLLENQSRL